MKLLTSSLFSILSYLEGKSAKNKYSFYAIPMFSSDGQKIMFSLISNNNRTRDTNLFVADWVD